MISARKPTNERERLAALRGYELLDTESEPAFDAMTRLAATLCRVPIALVSLVDENRQWFKSNCGLVGATSTERDVSFCGHAMLQDGIFEVPDAREDPRFADNPLVTGEPYVRFYAGVPLIEPGGMALGTLCVKDRKPRKLTKTQRLQLQDLAQSVVGLIVMRIRRSELEMYRRALQHSEAELSHRKHHDPLTNLPNRSKLMERLGRMIAEARREGASVLVLYLDLNHFKTINDTLGHTAADAVLVNTAGRISSTLRGDDIASRFGGDEFVLVCPAASGADATRIAERLQAAVHGPMEVNGQGLVVSCSIGISVYPQDGDEALDLVQKANLAMGIAKNSGCGTWCMYRDQIQLPAVSSLELELDLRKAIALEQFVVYYQPVISVDSGNPVGAEALVRWEHPVRGLLLPSEFISFAERYDLIAPIGEFVLHAACSQLQRLDLRASDDFSIAVNVSARQFTKPGFVGTVIAALAAYGLDARRLGIEITESVIMGDTAAVIATLAELKALGVKLSLDDFGTGYSSLAYIKNFPIHTLKIDRTFITDMPESRTDQAIAKTIITLAHNLGMNVIAEGVETAEQFDLLRAFGTNCVQGYFFSRPLSFADFEIFLARANSFAISTAILD